MASSNGRKKIGLALGGGVARGPAHVGVLAVLEQAGIPIDCVAGTSAGAVVGAAYCAGLEIPRLCALTREMSWRVIASLVWPAQGFITFLKMEEWFEELVGELDIRDLAIPFAAVTTDLETGESVILRRGRLATAVRASASVPGIITPVEIDGRLLCDGGVADNLPVDAVRALGADYVIGVDLFAPRKRPRWGPFGAGAAALETLIRRAGGGVDDADCLIVPDIADASFLRFDKGNDFIVKGQKAAAKMLPTIRMALECMA
jgi:NTE family protein